MTLGDMRALGVQRLIASCLNGACRHVGLINVSSYPGETEVPWFRLQVKCTKCGAKGLADRRAAELERAAATAELDGQAMAVAEENVSAYPHRP